MMTTVTFDPGSVAVVTGAGVGMGRAIAVAFARAGVRVVLGDNNVTEGAETARLIQCNGGVGIFQETDVRVEDDVERLVSRASDEFGRLDVMVNNAAVLGRNALIGDQTDENLQHVFGINVFGVVYGMKHALGIMAAQKRGAIVNMASVQGFRVLYPGTSFYAATKSAIVSLTKAAALEYGPFGVRVNAIAPGPIDTPMLRGAVGGVWPPPIIGNVPLARIGEPEDVANAVLWLASDSASYVSGATLPVDGGFLAP